MTHICPKLLEAPVPKHYEILEENPRETEETEITEMCIRRVEEQILAKPHNWLWTHRRWKHKRQDSTS